MKKQKLSKKEIEKIRKAKAKKIEENRLIKK